MMDFFESPRLLFHQTAADLQRLRQLLKAIQSEWKTESFAELDAKTGNTIHKVRLKGSLPDETRIIAFNAIQNIRHGLDQVAVGAEQGLTGVERSDLYFPISCNSAADLRGRLKASKISPELHATYEQFQTYPSGGKDPGGNDLLCQFNLVAQRKHRIICRLNLVLREWSPSEIQMTGGGQFYIFPAWDAVKQEMTLAVTEPGGSFRNGPAEFGASVCLFDAGPFTDKPVLGTLESVLDVAKHVLTSIEMETLRVLASRS